MGLVEKIEAIRGMHGLSPRTKTNALKELLEPFIDNKHKTFRAETVPQFRREYHKAPRYLKQVVNDIYGAEIMQNAGKYLGRSVQERTTTEVSLDLRGLPGDSPDIGRFYEDIPPSP